MTSATNPHARRLVLEIEWRPVFEWEDLYEVSSHGEVRNAIEGNVLRPFTTRKGYRIVKLCRDGVKKNFKVHRLVASAFIRLPDEGEQVNHRDLDKANNRLDNLEWVSCAENVAHFHASKSDIPMRVDLLPDARPETVFPSLAVSGHHLPTGACAHTLAPVLLGREARCVAQPFRPGFFIQER